MSDEKPQETPQDGISRMTDVLSQAIEGVRQESLEAATSAVTRFAEEVGASRSRTAPIAAPVEEEAPAPAPRVDSLEVQRSYRVLGDARDARYGMLYRGLSGEDLEFKRAARNPRIDELSRKWAIATWDGMREERAHLTNEINDCYLEALGVGRTLLEGKNDGVSPLSDGSGAETIPLPLAAELKMARDAISKARMICEVRPMTSQTDRTPVIPNLAGAARNENTAFTDVTPTIDKVLLTTSSLGTMFSAGRDLLEDTAYDLVGALTMKSGQAIGTRENYEFMLGSFLISSGATPGWSEGLSLNTTVPDVFAGTPGTLDYDDIVLQLYSLEESYRNVAVWICNSNTLIDIMKIKDDTNHPIFTDALRIPQAISDTMPGAVGTVLGRPIYEVADTPAQTLFFGDGSFYVIGERAGIRIDTDRDVTTGERTWVVDERTDGRIAPTTDVASANDAWNKSVYTGP